MFLKKLVKGLDKSEYWAWEESVTTDGVVDYSDETEYTIVECIDENVQERLVQLDDYVSSKTFDTGQSLGFETQNTFL